jgi:hypothetical protein
MLFFNFWYCGDLNNGGDWFHLTDPYLFKIHLGMDPSNSFVQQHIPVTSMKRILNVIVLVLLAQFLTPGFAVSVYTKDTYAPQTDLLCFLETMIRVVFGTIMWSEFCAKSFQCLCLLVAPIVFLQLQQQFPISLKTNCIFWWQSRVSTNSLLSCHNAA